ncbi:CrcB family protein [Arthrobacter sp. DNA4]|uniref:fluoride efflux transporter FluC n=1 Tax=Arthrobacter sp. DNA4 TaxID=2963432 RepID=UPI0020CF7860|nr:CrcB family protein [Arthrobacter sp. DNA4]UTT68839.1 CrcB family protein [Arthrobacter sp. DNA4]
MEQPVPGATAAAGADQGTLGEARIRRPVHLHPGFVLVVIVGGTFGALARYGLGSILPVPGGWPVPTLVINLAGAFLLGALLEALVRRGPDAGRLRLVRLLVGTGFLGAFTTYSTLAVEATTLFSAGRSADAFIYVATSVLVGAVTTVAGIRMAAAQHARTSSRPDAAGSPKEGNR